MPKKKTVQTAEETFGQRMAQLRQEAGYTQRDLAAELGISQRMVAYYEAQTEHPPTTLLPLLTEILGVSSDELLGIKPIKNNRSTGSQRLWRRLRHIEKLPAKERKQLLSVIDTFLERDKLSRSVG